MSKDMKNKIEIITAETAGFCFGVERAVNMVDELLNEGRDVSTLGPIIHNPHVIADFEGRGANIIEEPSDATEGKTVVLRSHGVTKEVEAELSNMDINYIDATCPFVKKIHRIVEKETRDTNTFVIIIGDKNHSEVKAIASYCNGRYLILDEPEVLEENLQIIHKQGFLKIIMVAQTTFSTKKFEKCKQVVNNLPFNVRIFDTICSATELRQKEAVQLAEVCDIMVVVGGRASSNTAKLADVCNQLTKTFLIESSGELNDIDFSGAKKVGITAGASTPARIIKEVQETMSDNLNNIDDNNEISDDVTFEEGLEQTLKTVSNGDKVIGHITAVGHTEVQAEIGTKHAGYIPISELTNEPDKDPSDVVKVGDELELLVVRVNDVEGTVMLSKRRLDAIAGYEKVCEAFETGEVLEGVVTDVVKGGIIVSTNGTRVFIPASLATASRTDSLDDLLKQTVKFKVIEVNKHKRRAVGSIRAILDEEQKELEDKFWETAEVGQVYKGKVKSLTSYGAFVDLGGVDGMIHISELSWTRIKNPSEVLSVGDIVEVYIKDLDKEKRRISLGYKRSEDNPWEILKNEHPLGSTMEATIVSMTPFGAFANILPGIDGLIHISQISTEHVKQPQDVLEIGQKVEVMLTDVDFERKRVSLSIRAIAEEENRKKGIDEEVEQKTPVEEADEVNVVYEAGPSDEE